MVATLRAALCASVWHSKGAPGQTSPALSQEPEVELKRRVSSWQEGLRGLLLPLGGNLMVDVPTESLASAPPRATLEGLSREEAAAFLSGVLHRRAMPLPKGWAYIRSPDYGTSARARYAAALRWMQTVSETELRALVGPGLAYANLSPVSKELFLGLCYNAGLQRKIARKEFVAAVVRLSFSARTRNAEGKEVSVALDAGNWFEPYEQARRERLQKAYVAPARSALTPLKSLEGDLDFSKGELMTVGELVDRAAKAFGRLVSYDLRLAPTYCYVQGRFTPETFLRYMKTVGRTIEWDYLPTTEQFRVAFIDAARRRLSPLLASAKSPEGVPYAWLLDGKTVAPASLEGLRGVQGIPPTATLTLFPTVTFQLESEGSFVAPGTPTEDGSLNVWGLTFGLP